MCGLVRLWTGPALLIATPTLLINIAWRSGNAGLLYRGEIVLRADREDSRCKPETVCPSEYLQAPGASGTSSYTSYTVLVQ